MSKRLQLSLIAVLVVWLPAIAQISPGKLSRFHSEIEGMANCTKCHELGKSVLASKCLECHDALKARIDAGKGYHATPEVTGSTCFKCHSDHHGEAFELIHWHDTPKDFDHNKTGFKLEGAHAKQECRSCHKAPFNEAATAFDKHVNTVRTFLGLNPSCTSCHEDEHRGSLDQNCTKCHTQDAWKPAPGFDHGKARYPLTGKHLKVECLKCHKTEVAGTAVQAVITKKVGAGSFARFKPVEFASCLACHKDVHNNKFGSDCASCHVTNSFTELKSAVFDHSKTQYPLVGKHLTVACAKCHTSGKKTEKMKFDLCLDCHKDKHNGQFSKRADGGECKSCHDLTGWLPATYGLEEHQKSRFALVGGHLATPCLMCHKADEQNGVKFTRFAFPDLACKVCHEDIHKHEADKWMTAKGCDACHTPESWKNTKFNHTLTKFPLEGKHQSKTCRACHQVEVAGGGKAAVKLTGLPLVCSGCHKDQHQGQFFADGMVGECSRCHTPANWKWLRFNHNDARYKLDGAHAKVACEKCHHEEINQNGVKFIRYRPLPMACSDCHSGGVGK